jgi:MRG-binding protein
MPPRKKPRLSTRSTPLREGAQSKAASVSTPAEKEPSSPEEAPVYTLQNDPWTDEEETLLFKSIVRWKPTG